MKKQKPTVGSILLSVPFLMDPYFRRSVIALCEHNDMGSLGLILNKRLDIGINELLSDFPEFDAIVHYGGPVQTDSIQYLHSLGDLIEGSKQVSKNVYWGGEFSSLKFLIKQGMVKPNDIRFYVGYSGWSTGQLSEEMKSNSWVVGDLDANYLFKVEPGDVWATAMEQKGENYKVIAQMPNEMLLN